MTMITLDLKALALIAFLTGSAVAAHASGMPDAHHGHQSESKMTMKEVMQGLNTALNNLTDAIILEDYAAIEQSARGIADHPPPAEAELERIFALLGTDSKAFKACDQAVHDQAAHLAKIAPKKNMKSILDIYQAMIAKTVECHARFKNQVSGQ